MISLLLRIVLAIPALSVIPIPGPIGGTHTGQSNLHGLDRRVLNRTATLAAQSPKKAVSWVAHHARDTRATLGADATTILLQFRDGRRVAIVGRRAVNFPIQPSQTGRLHFQSAVRFQSESGNNRAMVLEPFADELGLGHAAGQPEVDALISAGFSVDVKRNGDVTVPIMETLSNYSVVYMETHSGLLPNGDAIVATADTNFNTYSALAPVQNGGDGSLIQTVVAGDPTRTLYIGITSAFIRQHVGQFPENSLIFLNGCSLLRAPLFWNTLHDKRVAVMISWDQEAVVNVTDPAAAVVVKGLARGSSVTASINAAYDAGLGSVPAIPPAHLGFLGNGDASLTRPRQATPGTTASSTPNPPPVSATAIPPTPIPVPPTSIPRFKFTLVGARFEATTAKADPTGLGLSSVRTGSMVRLSVYYKVAGVPTACTYTETLTLSRGYHRIKSWSKHAPCPRGNRRDSVAAVTLSKSGTYTLSGHILVNGSIPYSKSTHINVQ